MHQSDRHSAGSPALNRASRVLQWARIVPLLCAAMLFALGCSTGAVEGPQAGGEPSTATLRQALEGDGVLSGSVFGGGEALVGALVEALSDGTTNVVASSTSDATGKYSLELEAGTYDLRVTPPSGSGFAIYVEQDVVISEATEVLDIVLIAEGGSMSGVVRGYAGVALSGMRVYAYAGTSSTQVAYTDTDDDGGYAFNLGAGTYRFLVQPIDYGTQGAPSSYFYYYSPTTEVSTATELDLQLPVARITGTVTDPDGAPVPDVTLSSTGSGSAPLSSYWYASGTSATSDADGNYEFYVFTGSNTFAVTPSSEFATIVEQNITISDDAVRDYVLSAPIGISGVVRGHAGVAVSGMRVYAYAGTSSTQMAYTDTDDDGGYAFNLGAGTYRFLVQPIDYGTEGAPSSYFYYYSPTTEVSAATELDLQLPVAKITGTVTDSNGAPVPNVTLSSTGSGSAPQSSYWYASNTSATSDADGNYQLYVFTGSNTQSIAPTDVSGFATTVLSSLSVTGDFSQLIVLQRPDLSPPVIVSGPLVVHLSDTSVSVSWETNEPADSLVEYGVGDIDLSEAETAMVTRHEVTLIDLLASTDYSFRVSSTDAAGNGPTSSELLTFRTQDPPGDVTAPVITAGPSVTSVGLDTAIISWTTDEPASSVLFYGTTEPLELTVTDPGQFTPDHQLKLTGLEPDTEYLFMVESTDPDGNGPTTSDVFSFTTASVPDTGAPIIVSGPSVSATSNTTLTLVWTTDEPATSGVSYNDGSSYDVVSDDTLVTEHEVVLAALSPDTEYTITVSSTDQSGNGPTLGGPISASTAAAADTTAPVITSISVEGIEQTRAVVSWSTDEPATSQVAFGLVSGEPSGLQGNSGLTTEHSVVLTGLEAGSTYYLSVTSQDGSGNAAQSDEQSFETLSADDPSEGGDADGDGVDDSLDVCPHTRPDVPVEAHGCSAEQLCPCDMPHGGDAAWESHEHYVECIADVAQRFWHWQLVSHQEAELLIDAASVSSCGS